MSEEVRDRDVQYLKKDTYKKGFVYLNVIGITLHLFRLSSNVAFFNFLINFIYFNHYFNQYYTVYHRELNIADLKGQTLGIRVVHYCQKSVSTQILSIWIPEFTRDVILATSTL